MDNETEKRKMTHTLNIIEKFFFICKMLPEKCVIVLLLEDNKEILQFTQSKQRNEESDPEWRRSCTTPEPPSSNHYSIYSDKQNSKSKDSLDCFMPNDDFVEGYSKITNSPETNDTDYSGSMICIHVATREPSDDVTTTSAINHWCEKSK